ncbi:MAG: ferrous iron transporter B [Acidimicrobiales bacterium]|nr:ferrous iron transporter B [Acidimicrobiales bacterium]MCB9396144.1 ferrous iron transporter B [Acidimicrobiaceae bacterium]
MTACHDDGSTLVGHRGLAQIALIGSPNAGKTTLFNALTGLRSKTANYPGITVTRREATVEVDGGLVRLVDLPGTYSLDPISPDEAVVADALHGRIEGIDPPDAIVMVADATTLERSLFLVAEVLRLDRPTCVVLTMIDELAARGGGLDLDLLSLALGIPVVGVVGHRGVGLDAVRHLLAGPDRWTRPLMAPPEGTLERSGWIESVLARATGDEHLHLRADTRTRRIDAVLLHPVAGSLVFVGVMLALFQSIFTLATPAVDWIDGRVADLGGRVSTWLPNTVGELLADGVVAGVGGVLVFLPQIVILLGLLAVLEKVGYLARAAFLADRVMGRFGLEGRSFVALLSSFACAIPGIMAARTIPNDRRRLATMMAAPLMTCTARLPVYTLLVSAFVADRGVLGPIRSQGLVMFGLYLLGAVSGLLYAGVLSWSTRSDASSPVLLEMPPYRWPTSRSIALQVWDGVWSFVRKAGTVILLTTIVLWGLLRFPSTDAPPSYDEARAASHQMEHSIAGRIGRGMEPMFAPMGFDWRANVAIIGSLAAREVFVSTLAITTAGDEATLGDRLRDLRDDDGDPVFDGPTVAALLVFFVYALQCTSTVAVLRRETNSWRWPAIAVGSMLALAYVAALIAHALVAVLA